MVHQSTRIRRHVPIPSSTPQSLVFEYDTVNKKFNTTNYQPFLTQNRATIEEVEQFLTEVNQPLAEWEAEYGDLVRGTGKYICITIVCFIIFPLFFCFICWKAAAMAKAQSAQKEYIKKAKVIIRDKSGPWIEKGLNWNVPTYFPRWIELWTSVGGGAPPQMNQTGLNNNPNMYGQNNNHNA